MRRTRLALIVVVLLSACGKREPGVYNLSRAEALQRLRDADLSGFIAARGCGVALAIAVKADGPDARRWSIRGEGVELAHFAVRLDDAGNGKVRAHLDVPGGGQGGAPLTAPSGATALRRPLQAAAVELVDAALDGRGFDPGRAGDDRPQVEACKASVARPVAIAVADAVPVNPRASAFGAPMVNTDKAALAVNAPPLFGQPLEATPETAR
ncbi:MAG: hypothetical protein KGN34_13455 [Sphingomonadales bacterium]|nr:hypothetical protein [Sphingomonadales bacterium]